MLGILHLEVNDSECDETINLSLMFLHDPHFSRYFTVYEVYEV